MRRRWLLGAIVLFFCWLAAASLAPAAPAASRDELIEYRSEVREALQEFRATRRYINRIANRPSTSYSGLTDQWQEATTALRSDAQSLALADPPTKRLRAVQNKVVRSLRSTGRAAGQLYKGISYLDEAKVERAAKATGVKYRRTTKRAKALYALINKLIRQAHPSESATAADYRLRKCGDLNFNTGNIRARGVGCSTARSVARAWGGRVAYRARGFGCRYRDVGYEAGKIGCKRGRARVVFYTGS